MMLAVGFINGDVNVYDVKRDNSNNNSNANNSENTNRTVNSSEWMKPIESSSNMTGGHTDPIWQVNYVILCVILCVILSYFE